MKLTRSSFALLTVMLLASALPVQTSARAIVSPTPEPFTYLVSPDGHRTPVYLMQDDPRIIEMALAQGIVTQGDVVKSQQFLEMHRANVAPSGPMISDNATEGSPWCPWGGTAATIISEGWDSDGDYYKDYEHPVGWNDDFVCMTVLYATTKGAPAHEYHNDYKPNIARHRLKIGFSGSPGWLASAQVYMRWNH